MAAWLDDAERDDLLQQVRVVLLDPRFRKIDQQERRRIAFGVAANLLKRKRRDEAIDARAVQQLAHLTGEQHGQDPADRLSDMEQRRVVFESILKLLDPKDQLILRLRMVDGLGFRQISAVLGLSEASARQRCVRALDRVRSDLFG